MAELTVEIPDRIATMKGEGDTRREAGMTTVDGHVIRS
jgi:hypothetical protein